MQEALQVAYYHCILEMPLKTIAEVLRRQSRSGMRGETATMISIDLPLTDEPEPPLLRHAAQA